jgi:tRNA(fMet)-specific endonuclease VapC
MFLLDSNTCIQFLNGRSIQIERRIMATKPSSIKLCSIVKAELLYGAERANNPSAVLARLTEFFAPFESLPFDDAAAVEYGRIRRVLAEAGTPIVTEARITKRSPWSYSLRARRAGLWKLLQSAQRPWLRLQ